VRDAEPVLIWPTPVATARSAINVSSVSAGAVRDDGGVAVAAGEINGIEGFTHRANLIQLNQDRVGNSFLYAFAEYGDVGAENIVADELDLSSELFGQICQPSQSFSASPSSSDTIG